jgi:neutral ceramidase
MRIGDRITMAGLLFPWLLFGCEANLSGGAELDDDGDVGSLVAGEACLGNREFLIGRGVYDITGPAAELGMMGYARLDQKTAGIHTRLRSRAFVFASPCNGKRVVFVSADLGILPQAVKARVVAKLAATYGDLYSDANVILSATHTHSGPGGASHYALYNLTVLGFDQKNFDIITDGIYRSIVRAHGSMVPGSIKVAEGEVLDAGVNRSPEAYLQNPAEERDLYASDTDTLMTLLRLQSTGGRELGALSWFAVHPTSMGNENHLISGDNKGYASYRFERMKNTEYGSADTFVAAFAQSNEGDVSPNIFGGQDGGGANDFESTAISGEKQLGAALALYRDAAEPLTGGIEYRHAYVKMDAVVVAPELGGGQQRSTCKAAIGFSMIAGAEDGPGFGDEGLGCEGAQDLFGVFGCELTTTECQGEKPIVLETGSQAPYPWTPEILPVQIAVIGDLAIVAVPFEATTMAGRRLRQAVLDELAPAGVERVVLAGLSNAYSGYVATREEYAIQHYEGASTHFGPYTLAAYQQEFSRLAAALRDGLPVASGPAPRDLSGEQTSIQTGVAFDDKPLLASFGSVIENARTSYTRGQTARVTFWGGHPKNDPKIQSSYLQVQRKSGTSWVTVARDWDWETKYTWERDNCLPTLACSRVTIEWKIPQNATPGTYRIRHDGHWKSGWDGKISPYTGFSRQFLVQ